MLDLAATRRRAPQLYGFTVVLGSNGRSLCSSILCIWLLSLVDIGPGPSGTVLGLRMT
jgi:hypothetical protein